MEPVQLCRQRALSKLLVGNPQACVIGKQHLDARSAPRNKQDTVARPRFKTRCSAFAQKTQVAFAKVNKPLSHDNPLDALNTQHDTILSISERLRSSTATVNVIALSPKEKVA